MSNLVPVGGVEFSVLGTAGAIDYIVRSARDHTPTSVRFGNAYTVGIAHRDGQYCEALHSPGINFPDGVPVALTVALRNRTLNWRKYLSRGPEVFRIVLESEGIRHFILGGTPDSLRKIENQLLANTGENTICGSFAPPFGSVNEDLIEECVARVQESGADIVWIGLGSPKQDILAWHLAPRVNRICVGVGAAFDFYSGTVREAPRWLRGSGFEWIYRLSREPRRLLRRYTVGNIDFFKALMKG